MERILRWADAHRTATGAWPGRRSGPVRKVEGEFWSSIDIDLLKGRRGLPGRSSLAWLLAEERGVTAGANPAAPGERLKAWEAENFPARKTKRRPTSKPRSTLRLSIDAILAWADAHHEATGKWPRINTGPLLNAPELNWGQVDRAMVYGYRGLKRGSTLADLLQDRRGVRNKQNLPRMDVELILKWVDAHREATGEFPQGNSGPVLDAPGETWNGIQSALSKGLRGLPGGSSLAQLITEHHGYRAPLTIERILGWADAHFAATGKWPTSWSSGPLRDVPGESWGMLCDALRDGRRGLPGGTTLARLLAEHRQAPNIYTEPPLTIEKILAWAEAHREATGRYPTSSSGPVLHAEGESWGAIETALRDGYRSLPGGQALGRLIRGEFGPHVHRIRPELTVDLILEWADAHREASGDWPIEDSGPVLSAPDEKWAMISGALARGNRGLPGGTTLARLLEERRGARNQRNLPRLTVDEVLGWADAHHEATGRWPSAYSGPVAEGSPETWAIVNSALSSGTRGLPGGSSLARLIAEHRPVRPRRLTMEQVRTWAEAHREATGRWPDAHAGPVRGVPDENWGAVNASLKYGHRGLPGGTTLTELFDRSLDPDARGLRPELTVEQILAWADAYHAANGRWPSTLSGPVEGQPGEKWVNIRAALRLGRRGLPKGTSLARLLADHRGAPLPSKPLGSRRGPDAAEMAGATGRP